MECIIETKAATVLEFIQGLRGSLWVTFEEGTSAAWLYDLLKPHVTKVVVCDPPEERSAEGRQAPYAMRGHARFQGVPSGCLWLALGLLRRTCLESKRLKLVIASLRDSLKRMGDSAQDR
jgi:hypothetical protein